MPSKKMVGFLKSINIENYFDYDLEFEMIGKNRFNPKKYDMIILKETPWDYKLLRQFLDSLSNITYEYSLQFSYLTLPSFDDVFDLFNEWYHSIYRLEVPFEMIDEDEVIKFVFKNEKERDSYKQIIQDFESLLNFINYEFVVKLDISNEVDNNYSKRKIKKVTEEAKAIALDEIEKEKEIKTEVIDSKAAILKVNEEHKEVNSKLEDSLLEEMKKNAQIMAKERERIRLNKRGNYQYIENIDSIDSNSGNIDFNGKIFSIETSEYNGKRKFNIGVHDPFGGAIYVLTPENATVTKDFVAKLQKGDNIRVRGVSYIDEYTKQLTIRGHLIDILPPDEIPHEKCQTPRVELHLHSQMSVQDGVGDLKEYAKYMSALGHKAFAITDHGVVQGFPDACKAGKKYGLKVIYGCELYMVDDQQTYIFNPKDIELNKAKYVVLDTETTGLSCRYNRMIEFGAVKVEKGTVVSSFDTLINPGIKIPEKITKITHITDEMVKDKPTIKEALAKIVEYVEDAILVTHNAEFDINFINEELKRNGMPILTNPVIDTLSLARHLYPENRKFRLGDICRRMDINYDSEAAHRADYDALVLNDVWQSMLSMLLNKDVHLKHSDLLNFVTPKELLRHIMPKHVVVLVKNKAGLKDLYKLVSISHVDYFYDVPKVPRKELEKHRKNLFVGSACFNGEIFRSLRYDNEEKIKDLMKFYDYIEVQPMDNYSFLVNMGDLTQEEVNSCVNDCVKFADELNIPVVATGDCHYVKKEDKIFRDVYINSLAVGRVSHPLNPYSRKDVPSFENPDQHYRSTDEMLECFSFLGEQKAYEIVVTNSNKIADEIEEIEPIPSDKLYTPKIDNCENMLKDLCYQNAHKLYGDPLPEFIQNRLDTELQGIINNGYSVIYWIAHCLVKKANEDGYIVGSRGSVGSSFVATMASITEVNPLPPHYRCPKCKHLEWTSETMPAYRSGYDLPNKKCPICGEQMAHDGQNIPFETFLGFSAEKTPDIDLNFPGDYQAKAHDYTKVLLGVDNVFRAGTIGTVAEKTAFGFARGYLERIGVDLSTCPKAKIAYIASGCVNVKRTTGQHPGGIVVIPKEYDVYDFTPIQYPADEVEADWKTTHFDFHSLHDTILKLDLLGHVDPVALKMMCTLTKVKIEDIPLNDPQVLSLFSSVDALHMNGNFLAQKTGALGIPEFGTSFVRGILESTKPKTFSDLVIISGLSHGTNVWNGNAERWIQEGKATLQEVIGCRDDIMTYLISKGLPSSVSFQIMEKVRKGYGLSDEYIEIMKAHNVPDFYIESCKLIAYLFPKGHATAYVTQGIRVGYFKVYYPLEYYATFFSVRSDYHDVHAKVQGEKGIIERLNELKLKDRSKEGCTPKEKGQITTLQIAIEMVQRGYKFHNISLEHSDGTTFVVDHENNALYPSFITIDGLGESAAQSIVDARKERPFSSKKDLLKRTKLSNTNIKDLEELGVLKGLPEDDQLSLFDLF
ncbi:MAG: PolC-type DNA polymerase III [Bacilli bacterium]